MPHFDEDGNDTYLCQAGCMRVLSATAENMPVWRPDITGHEGAGNTCPDCLRRFESKQSETKSEQSSAARIYWINARYASRCPACLGAIAAGERIGKPDGRTKFACSTCATSDVQQKPAQRRTQRTQTRSYVRPTVRKPQSDDFDGTLDMNEAAAVKPYQFAF